MIKYSTVAGVNFISYIYTMKHATLINEFSKMKIEEQIKILHFCLDSISVKSLSIKKRHSDVIDIIQKQIGNNSGVEWLTIEQMKNRVAFGDISNTKIGIALSKLGVPMKRKKDPNTKYVYNYYHISLI